MMGAIFAMKRLTDILKVMWDWMRIIFVKTCQGFALVKELLRPGRSLGSRIALIVWVLVLIAFVINSFTAFYTTTVQLVQNATQRCETDLAAMKAISDGTLEDLEQSSDTIHASDALAYLMKRLLGNKPNKDMLVCIADTTGKVILSEDTLIHDLSLGNESDTLVLTSLGGEEIHLNFTNMMTVDSKRYSVSSAPIWDGRWHVAVLESNEQTWGTILELFLDVSRRCVISIMLVIIGFMAMFIIMRHALLRKTTIEGEMDHAGSIQQQMLLKTFPESEDFKLYGFLRPAKTMGGDLYDYLLRDGKLYFCLGDVSGKGMPAALMMSEVRSLFRNVARHTENPDEIASAINVGLADGNESNMFCTLFVGALDLNTKLLRFCNAGHNPPIVLQPEHKPRFLDVLPNLATGLFDEFPYQVQELQMLSGMSLFVYTDGVSEAEDVLHRLFTDEALLDKIEGCEHKTPKETVEYVLSLVDHHARMTDQSDDITMVCVKV